MQVSGLAILALGIWMKVQLHIYMELTTIYFDAAPYILIAVGCTQLHDHTVTLGKMFTPYVLIAVGLSLIHI